MKVVIVEDEILLQKELKKQLQVYEEMEVVQCIQTVEEGIAWLSDNASSIDLIFMDIELADGVCFEIFEAIDLTVPIIFLTAYSEYAIRAFKVNSIDYLLKPINPKELAFALTKFKKSQRQAATGQIDLSTLKDFYTKSAGNKKTRFLVQSGDTYKYISINEIAYFHSEDKYSVIVTFDRHRYLIDESLHQLENTLPSSSFHRPTRNIIVHIKAVEKASKYFNSRLKLYLQPRPDFDVIVSRVKIKDFLTWMGSDV
ncbi:MAG: response regulator transcription factor [Saprospiraceae bacterium]|nr:response regulator transcription factor [Saprospiraceae bacterium]